MIDVRTGELGAPVALRIPGWKPGTPTVRDLKIAIKSKARQHGVLEMIHFLLNSKFILV